MGDPPQRVVVFVDYQNVLNDARHVFHEKPFGPADGQIDPIALGHLLARRHPFGVSERRACHEVRVYRGRPDPRKEPQTNAAHMRQCQAWESAGASVTTRPLRYPRGWPKERAEEKGIDVQIAIDIVMMAINQEFDVAILASTDTDQRPVLEALPALPMNPTPAIEVAAWRGERSNNRLSALGVVTWPHLLEANDYRKVRDTHDYNLRSLRK
jgi:hypothetical protein